MASSFPYFNIAREHGVSYGHVLRLVESYDQVPPSRRSGGPQLPVWMIATIEAWDAEKSRRAESNPKDGN